jgi:hypothetical protein
MKPLRRLLLLGCCIGSIYTPSAISRPEYDDQDSILRARAYNIRQLIELSQIFERIGDHGKIEYRIKAPTITSRYLRDRLRGSSLIQIQKYAVEWLIQEDSYPPVEDAVEALIEVLGYHLWRAQ